MKQPAAQGRIKGGSRERERYPDTREKQSSAYGTNPQILFWEGNVRIEAGPCIADASHDLSYAIPFDASNTPENRSRF